MTSPPSIDCTILNDPDFKAQTQTVVRIPRTTSVPIYNPSFSTTFSLANHSNVLNRLDEAIPAASMPIFTPLSLSSTSINELDYSGYCNSNSVPLLYDATNISNNQESQINNFRRDIEISSELPLQNFTLSASTNSVAFYRSAQPNCANVSTTPIKIKKLSEISSGSIGGSTSTQSSLLGNQPPALLLQYTQQRFPLSSNRVCLSNILEQYNPLTINNFLNIEEEDSIKKKHKQHKVNFKETESEDLTELEKLNYSKKHLNTHLQKSKTIKPAPPPRKPCCSNDEFPPLLPDILNDAPSLMSYSTILERSMLPILKDIKAPNNIDFILNTNQNSFAQNSNLTPNNILKFNNKKNNKNNISKFAIKRGPGITDV